MDNNTILNLNGFIWFLVITHIHSSKQNINPHIVILIYPSKEEPQNKNHYAKETFDDYMYMKFN